MGDYSGSMSRTDILRISAHKFFSGEQGMLIYQENNDLATFVTAKSLETSITVCVRKILLKNAENIL